MYRLILNDDCRIIRITFEQYEQDNPNSVAIEELPEGDVTEYKYINNEYVHDPLPPEPESEPEPTQEQINAANIDYIAMMTDVVLPMTEV